MLVEFSVTNFRSFNQKQTLSMESEGKDGYFYETGFKKAPRLTHIAGFYGANGSGKSNVFSALQELEKFARHSFKLYEPNEAIKTDVFCLSSDTKNAPTEFYVKFIQNDKLYEYEFHYTTERILLEKLTYYKKDGNKPQRLNSILDRIYDTKAEKKYKYNSGLKSVWSAHTRENVLALSTAANLDDTEAKEILKWFQETLNVFKDNQFPKMPTINKSETHKQEIRSLIQKADIGIVDYEIVDNLIDKSKFKFPDHIPEEIREMIYENHSKDVIFTHHSLDPNHNKIEFDEESKGTKIFFGLSGILLELLEKGEIICIDEIDANMHPRLLQAIIDLFQNPTTNPNHAQLIFSAHNTLLMEDLIPEQIWFTQKDKTGATEIFSLLDFKLNKDDNYIKNYHLGMYGAVPYIKGYLYGA